MAIMWEQVGPTLKRRREQKGFTQDVLASKVGVRWNTIARVEIGQRRPSLDLLDQLARALECRVRDLLPEDHAMHAMTEREPSMKGAPSYFRASIKKAATQQARDGQRASYTHAGWTLGIHIDELLSDEAAAELREISRQDRERLRLAETLQIQGRSREDIEEQHAVQLDHDLLRFLDREFPGCMALVPNKRRSPFMRGVYRAIEDGRLSL